MLHGDETLIALKVLLKGSNKRDEPAGEVSATINLSCFLFISVLIVCIFVIISSLLYAYVAVIVKLLSSSVNDKLEPTIFFNLDVVVFNKLLLPVISVPLLIVFCLSSNLFLIVVKN